MQDAMHAEAAALLKAIEVVVHVGMRRVVFQTDCLPLQQATASLMLDRNPLDVLFREAKFQMQQEFIVASIVFQPRECNKPAHVLAASVNRNIPNGQSIWLSEFPVDVTRAVAADLVGPP